MFGVVAVIPATVTACSPSAGTAPAATSPYTGPAAELAASQMSMATVPEPTLPDRCPPDSIVIAAREGSPPNSDVVVTFHNAGAIECEVDVDLAWATMHQIEPSVRLAAGATAELWGVAANCADDARATVWELDVNGIDRAIALPASLCEPVPVAFFPA